MNRKSLRRWLAFSWVLGMLISASSLLAEDTAEEVDRSISQGVLDVGVEVAFPETQFDRPVLVTHAGDGSGRLFVVGQRGTIHTVKPGSDEGPELFLDIREQVRYSDRENEEGLLGVAFHPNFEENGEFFVYYSTRKFEPEKKHVSVLSRIKTKDNAGKEGDPATEETLLTIEQPYWNHNGGTIDFGNDGFLYIALGDGGSANDPHGNAQNLATLLGSVLRIDVDTKSGDLPYGIPADNPFVDKQDARPEIWAYGIRNIWRMAFDPKTGHLWAGDVGQNIWEEVDVIERGGNYGWNRREGKHPFGENGSESDSGFAEPVLEYHHDIGKSITGGAVYRSERIPELNGKYLFADYVSGLMWALDVDDDSHPVHSIEWAKLPVMTFGQGEDGEVYFTTTFGYVYRFVAK